MQIQTLCPVHSKWLALHPEQAFSYINRLHGAGQKLQQEGSVREAIPYLHCAYEVSALMLERQIEQNPQVVIQYTGVALSLAEALRKYGLSIKPGELMQEACSKLEECSADIEITPFVPQYLEQCLNALRNGINYFSNSFSLPQNGRMSVH